MGRRRREQGLVSCGPTGKGGGVLESLRSRTTICSAEERVDIRTDPHSESGLFQDEDEFNVTHQSSGSIRQECKRAAESSPPNKSLMSIVCAGGMQSKSQN